MRWLRLCTLSTTASNASSSSSLDGSPPEGASWHRDLLLQMAESTSKRPALLSSGLRESLQQYLGFRHYFRHAYAVHFEWDQMRTLVDDLADVYLAFRGAVDAFLDRPGTL